MFYILYSNYSQIVIGNTLVTNIKGLDVTHMGIAVWVGNKLHMLHASYNKKKVIIDDQTLYDYLKTRKSAPGIRVVRVK